MIKPIEPLVDWLNFRKPSLVVVRVALAIIESVAIVEVMVAAVVCYNRTTYLLNIFHDIPPGVQLGTNDREAGVPSWDAEWNIMKNIQHNVVLFLYHA